MDPNQNNNEMDDLFGLPPVTPPVEPPTPPVEPPVEPPQVEPPPEEPPVVEPPVAPPVEPPPAEPPPAEPPVPSVDPKDAQIAEMQATIEELRKTIQSTAVTATAAPAVEQPPAGGEPPVAPVYKFVEKEEDLDSALNSVDNFNGMLGKVVEKAQESVLRMIPQMIVQMADQTVTQRMAVAEFYANNKDLAAVDATGKPLYKAFVGMVANEIAAAHADWGLDKVIEELGPEVRKRLRLNVQVPLAGTPPAAPSGDPPDTPAFVPPGGARSGGGAPSLTKMEKEIADLLV